MIKPPTLNVTNLQVTYRTPYMPHNDAIGLSGAAAFTIWVLLIAVHHESRTIMITAQFASLGISELFGDGASAQNVSLGLSFVL